MRRTRRSLAAVALLVATLSLAASRPAEAQTTRRYIVTVASTGPVATTVQNLLASAGGGTVVRTYSNALHGALIDVSPAVASLLATLPGVTGIEADGVMTLRVTQSPAPSWGLDRIDQTFLPLSNSYSYTSTGAGVKAYMIDTGIQANNVDFGGRVQAGTNTVDTSPSTADCNGHGTHTAGTVGGAKYGVAKGVTLVAVRVFGCGNSTSTSAIISGVEWVTGNHQAGQPAVANMSLGGGASTALDTAVRNMIADGVSTSVAAGNDNANSCSNSSPARVIEAITVGATDINDNRASFSNYGTCLDINAPGVSIVSDYMGSTTATATLSGTSMATPHVVGAAARYLQSNPSAPPSAVRDALVNASTKGVIKGIPTSCTFWQSLLGQCGGFGTPNRLLFAAGGS
jgi:subtilisin family serine protease